MPTFLLLNAALPASGLTLTELTKSDLDSYADSSSVASRSYRTGAGQIELAPIVQSEAAGLGANPILSLAWQQDTLWAGGTSGAAPTVSVWRRTPAGAWQNQAATVPSAQSMAMLAVLGDTLYGGPANNLGGGDNVGDLLAWNNVTDTWELKRDLNLTDANFDGFGRGKGIWNNALYLSGGRTNSNTFLAFVDGVTGDVDFKSLENPPPTGGVGNEYDGVAFGMVAYPVAVFGGAERIFWGPLNSQNLNFGNIARSREFGAFPAHITKLDNTSNAMEMVGAARLNQSGIGDTLFVLLEGGVAGNNVIYTTTDGTNFTGKITKNALQYSGDFGNGGIGVTEAFAMRAFGRDIWIGGTLDTVVRYVGDYDTFSHFFLGNLTSGIREFEPFRGLDGETWLAIAGGSAGSGRIDRFRFTDSGTYTADTKILASDTWLVADSVEIRTKANGCTVLVSFFFGRDTAELAARTFGETFTISGDTRGTFTFNFTKPFPSGRASGNAWRRMIYRVSMQTENTLVTPYFEGITFHFHQDVTAPETAVLTAPSANLDTNQQRPLFMWTASQDTVNGTLESGFDTFLLEIDTGIAGAFANPHRFTLAPDSISYRPLFDLGPDTIYRWRVRAYDTASNVATSETRLLTIDITPPVPVDTAIAPFDFADTTATTVTLRWSAASDTLSGLSYYMVQLESGVGAPSFATPDSWRVDAPDTFRTVGPLALSKNDTWYWRVIAYDSATNNSTSPIFSFRVRSAGAIVLTDSSGAPAASFTTRETVTIRLTDTDRNRNPAVAETIQVIVVSLIGEDTKAVTLTENTVDAALFVGVIALSDTTAATAALRVGVGDTITFFYSDSLPPFTPVESAETNAATTRFSSASSVSFDTSEPRILTRPILTVTDPDRNRNPLLKDTVIATLANPTRIDTETLILLETTDTSGVFTADTVWISDTIGTALGDLALFSGPGDVIELRYTDNFDAPDMALDTAVIFRIFRSSSVTAVDSTGTFVDSAAPGDTLASRVIDPDANLNVQARDTITLLVRNLQTGETETIVLEETTDTSGIFGPDTGVASSLLAADAASNSDTLFVVLGKIVRFEYADAGDAVDSGTDTITILFRETVGTVDHTDSYRLSIASIRRDSGVFVIVTDSDRNRNGTLTETVSVIVRALRSGDSETITLTETSVTSGIFWNASILRTIDTGTASVGNGILTIAPSHDTVVAEYTDGGGLRTDTVLYIFSRSSGQLAFINKLGIIINQFIAGETVTARVIDPDQNATVATEGTQETVLITLISTSRNDTETIVLFESAFLSGLFDSVTGRATSADPADSLPNDGTLFVISGDTVIVHYADPSDAFDSVILIVVAASTPTPSSAFLSDSIGGAIDTYFIADSFVFATVTDTDENLFPGAPDDVTANIICYATGDSETITLTEIGNDSNVFRNAAGLAISDTQGGSIGDGILFAGRGDTISLQYIDATDATDSSADSAAIVGETTSSVTAFDAASYAVPETATLTVTDADRNADPQLAETFNILVRSTTTLDTENVLLTETSETSGVFAGTLSLSNFTGVLPGDGTLLVAGGDVIVADYVDTITSTDTSFDTAGITIAGTLSTIAILDSGQISVETLARGETFTVRVIDADANTNPLTAQTVVVVLRNDRTGETENLTLTEISTASETFLSMAGETLSASPADSGSGSGAIFALNGDSIRATYTQGADSSTDTARVSSVPSTGLARLTDGGGLDRDTYSLSFDSVFIRLRDPDRNLVGIAVETVSIFVQIPSTGDFETVTLTEATADTENFISVGIPIVDSAAVAGNNGVLVAGTADTMLLSYTDVTNGDTSSDTALAVAFPRLSTVRLINGAGDDVVAYSLADSVRIEVRDPNANRKPLTAETVSILVLNPRTGETETTTLTETGIFSGVFRFDSGIRITSNIVDSAAADTMYALSGDSLIATYTDAYDATDTSTDTARIVPVATNSAILFSDSAGNSIATYATDTFVHVTLTDTDQNTLGTAIETLTVTVAVLRTGDSEILSVTELAVDSGVFRNLVGLRLSDTVGAVIGDGVLFASTFDTLLVTYQDPVNSSDSTTGSAAVRHESTVASVVLDRSSYAPESGVVITLTDRSRNANVLGQDTVTVTATDTESNDTETVTLTETTDTSGIFTGPLLLSDTGGAGVNSGILLVGFGDTFTVRYTDADDASDSADTQAFVLTVLTPGSVSFNATSYTASQKPAITLLDRNRNLDPLVADTVNVIVRVSRTGETATITLTETGAVSGVFDNATETLGLTTAASAPTDDTLSISNGDTIVVRYDDPADATDTRETAALITPVPTQGVLTLSAAAYKVGDTFTLTLADDDRNISSFVNDTVILRNAFVLDVNNSIVDNVFNVVVLRETSPTSGVFVPDAPFWLSDTAFPVVGGDQILSSGVDFELTVEYLDPVNFDFAFDTADVLDSPTVSAGSFNQSSYALGETAFVTIIDRDENRHPTKRDLVTAVIRNLRSNEVETRVPRETGEVSFNFFDDTGLFLSPFESDSPNGSGKLYVLSGDTLRLEYTDANFAADTFALTVLIDTIPPTTGVIDFTDASGGAVLFYRPGDSVYAQVTDTDMNRNPLLAESVTVTIRALFSPDTETVILTEISLNSASFRNAGLPLSDTQGSGAGDGILTAGFTDSLAVVYQDPNTATDSSADTVIVAENVRAGIVSLNYSAFSLDTPVAATVADSDENLSPFAPDTLTVTYTTLLGADTETRILTETTDTSGVFTAAGIGLSDTTGGGTNDGILMAGVGDTITVTYVDARGTVETVTAASSTLRRSTLATFALDRDTYFSADTAGATLTDTDRNRNPRQRDTVSLALSDARTGDSETIILTETTDTSGQFFGTAILSETAALTPGDSTLRAQVGDTIQALYTDAYDATDTKLDTASIVPTPTSSALLLDRETYVAATLVVIRLADMDQNRDALVADTVTVTVRTFETGDSETVTLTETAASSGIFTNSPGLRLSDTEGVGANNGILIVGAGDTFDVAYIDPANGTDSGVDTATFVSITAATIVMDSTAYRLDTRPFLTLTDADRNRDPLQRDTAVITLVSPKGDTEQLTLRETTDTSGIFVGDTISLTDTAGAVVGDSLLFVGVGDVIEARYTDAFNASDTGLDTATILRIFRPSSVTAVDSTGTSVDSAAPGDTLSARVTDPDGNLDPSARDTVQLLVRNLQTGETEAITLVETTDTSGVFGPDTGLVTSLTSADSGSNSGTLFVVPGKVIRFEYTDGTDSATDTLTILFRPTAGSVAPTDSLGVTQTEYARDSAFFVTVTDTDQNRNGTLAETVSAIVASLRGTDTETITLTEVTLSDASFRNLVALALVDTGTAAPGDGRLTVRPAYDTIIVSYYDGFDTRSETAAFIFSRSAGGLRFINRLGLEAAGFLIGETITARVTDPDQNATVANEGQVESVIVIIRNMNPLRDNTETIVLFEISNLAARFDSSVGLPTSTDPADSVPGNDTLQVFHGDTVRLRYVDPGDPNDSVEVVVTAVGETSASLTVFSDNSGIDAETYTVPSGLLYVTVRDTDQNLSNVSAQQISVTVWSQVGQDTITVTLTELGVDTVFFRNTIGVRLSDTEGIGSNAILLVGRPDTIFVRYTDSFDPSDVTEDSALIVSETTASITALDSPAYAVPETAVLTVTDPDRNLSPHQQDTIPIVARSFTDASAPFDTEALVLVETTETSGLFRISLLMTNLGAVVEGDGILSVTGGGTIRVDYADPGDATDTSVDTAGVTIVPTPSVTTLLDSALASTGSIFRLIEPGGETITARVVQASANRNPLLVDTIAVTFSNLRTGETTSLTLVESGISTETFLSTAGLLLNPDTPAGGGAIHARPGDTIRAQYKLTSESDSSFDTALVLPSTSQANMILMDGFGLGRDTYATGDSLFFVVIDTDRNRNAISIETFTVGISIPRTGDAETVTLSEASADSSRFLYSTGLAVVDTAAVAVNDGRLVAGPGDSIVVSYIDALQGDTAVETAAIVIALRPATARLINAIGVTVTQYLTSDSVRAEVIDPNANLDPLATETIAALVRNPRTGETEPMIFLETGAFSGAFRFETGVPLSTNPADSTSADGTLFALSSDTIEIEYIDPNDPSDVSSETALVRPTPTQGMARFTDTAGTPVTEYRMDTLAFVTLADTDQNISGTEVETVTVVVRDAATGDSETLQLTESNSSSGVFRNLAGLPLSDTVGVGINDGVLFTGVVLQIRVEYIDAFNGDTDLDTATLARAPTSSNLAFDRSSYAPETNVFVSVSDADRNRNPLIKDTVTITLVNSVRNDTETATLTETSETSGIFTNVTPFRVSDTTGFAVGDGILLCALGDTFVARYLDAFDGTDTADTVGQVILLNTAATPAFDSSYYRVADTVGLQVIDRDRNLNPRAKDTVTVEVFNPRNNDSEILTLFETESASFTFTFDTPLLRDSGTASVGNGVLLIGAGDTIVLRFTDPANADSTETIATILSQPTQARFSLSFDSVTDGFRLTVDVIDMDRNLNQTQADSVILREVRVRSPVGFVIDNEFQKIILTETGDTTGVFRSETILFSSQTTPGQAGDKTLLIGFGHTAEFEYRDAINGDNVDTEVPVSWFTTPSSSTFDRAVYVVGMRAYGAVTDTEWNRIPLDRDSVTFVITNLGTGETETRTGLETANRSGVFQDTEGLLLSGAAVDSLSNTGILWIRTGDTLQIDYIDSAIVTDTSFDTAGINIAPPATISFTRFTNSAGTLLAIYRMDSFVFVTVTDTDKNVSGTLVENVQIDLVDTVTGDSERITLTEVAADTGVFRNAAGQPLSDTIGVAINDGVLFTGSMLAIRAFYIDAIDSTDSTSDTATLTRVPTAAAIFLDRVTYAPETGVVITVMDTDRNRNPTLLDTVIVTITNTRRGDTETLVLTQSSETSSVFANTPAFPLSDTAGFAAGDGILLAALGDTFRVVYADADDATDSADTTGAILLLNTTATGAFDRDTYRLTDSVVLTIIDRDRNLDPRAKDTLMVHVRNFRNGDSEPVTLTETDSTSLTFTGASLIVKDTGAETPGDGVLHARNNDTLILLFADPANGDTVETAARMGVTPSQATLSIPTPLTVHDTFQILLSDQDRNTNQLVAETITLRRIQIRDSDGVVVEDDENVFLLTETTETSGIFSFATPLQLSDTASPVTAGDSLLTAGLGFRIAVEYLDPINSDFVSETVTIVDSPTPSFASFNQASYQLASTAYATIIDRDENRHPLRRDTIIATVRNLATNETEVRTLRETGNVSFVFTDETGLFLSSLSTDSASNSGKLYVREGDTIRVEYTDANDASDTSWASAMIETIAATAGVVRWTNAAGILTTSFQPGDSVFAQLTDTDRNLNPLLAETVTVILSAVRSPDTETLVLTEAGLDTSVFRSAGTLLSDTRGLTAGDSILAAGFGDSIVVFYDQDAAADTAAVADRPTSASIGFSLSSYGLDSTVNITVADTDQNINPYGADTLVVTIVSSIGADTETFILTETTDTSGVFAGAAPPLSDTTGTAPGDNILMAGVADTLTVTYVDPLGTAETTATTSITARRSTPSTLALDFDTYMALQNVVMTLTDTDRNRNPRARDTLAVTLRDPTTTDSETVILTETTDTSGVFTDSIGLIKIGLPTINDGQLLVQVGDTIIAEYPDAYDAGDTSLDTALIVATPGASTIALDRLTYQASQRVVITVVDLDQNLNALSADTIEVWVWSSKTNDAETVVLTETAAASGIFANAGLRLSDTTGVSPNDSILLIGTNDTFLARYTDPDFPLDVSETTATFVVTPTSGIVRGAPAGGPGAPVRLGDTLQIEVTDPDRNRDPLLAETIVLRQVQVVDLDSIVIENEFEAFLLVETTETSGVFLLPTPFLVRDTAFPVTGGDTTLTAGPGFRIRIDYLDPIQADFSSDSVLVVESATISSASFDSATYALAETAYVTVIDRDENRHPLRRDTIIVTVRNLATNETEVRTLRETGEVSFVFTDETGLFLSSLSTDSASNSGKLYVSIGDTIRVEYTDSNDTSDTSRALATIDTITPTVGVVWWTNMAGIPTTSFQPGDSVRAMLTDADRNLNPLLAETVTVILSAVRSPDTEMVILTEAGLDTAVFRSAGTLLSDTRGLTAGDSILAAGFGDSMVVFYDQDAAADTAAVADRPTSASIGFSLSSYGLDSTVSVTVTDTDQNINPYGADTLVVTIVASIGADTETFILTETTDTSGIFAGAAPPLSDTTGTAPGDSILMAGVADTLTVTYVDSLGTTETRITTATTVRRATPATITLDAATYQATQTVVLTLTDTDRNRRPRLADTVLVTLYNPSTTDSETILLTETTETSRVFSGSLPLKKLGLPTVNDGFLLVQVGDTIFAEYRDAYDAADTAVETAVIIPSLGISSILLDRLTYQASQRVVITIEDPDQNINALLADTLMLQVWSSRTNDAETVVLTETDASSGIFRNTPGLRLSDTIGVGVTDGILLIGTDDTFLVRYVDSFDASDSCETTATFVVTPTSGVVRGAPAGGPGTPARLGETLQIEVTDLDRNRNPLLAETIVLRQVQVVDLDSIVIENEFEAFLLVETTDTSGVFRLSTSFLVRDTAFPVTAGDTTLTAGPGFRIRIDYLDPLQLDFSSDSVLVVESSTISSAFFNRATYGLAETAYITIIDRDENRHPLRRDTLLVTVSNTATGETEVRTLRETGEVSFVFTDETGLFLSSLATDSASNSGKLYVRAGDTIRVDYIDPNTPPDTSVATALMIPASSTPSTIRFTDSSGATLLSFRPGDSVYCLLIDTGLNQDPLKTETVTVTLSAVAAPDTETIVLTEISDSTAVFRSAGILLSDTRGTGAGDGILTAGFTDTLVVLYLDPNDGTDSATASASVLENVSNAASTFSAAAYNLDSSVIITVTDADENLRPFTRDTIIVVFSSRIGADTETRILEETTETSGFFTFTGLPLSDTTGGATGNGTLMAGAGDTVTATYVDGRGTIETVSITIATLRRSTTARLAIDRASYYATDSALVTLTDTDRNRHPRLAETIAVSVRSSLTADSETIVLTESTETSAVFAGLATFIETGLATPGDGFLLVQVGDTVVVAYLDLFDAADTAIETAPIVLRRTTAVMTLNRDTFQAAHSLIMTISDPDQNLRALTSDTIEVLVISHGTNDAETVVLTETASASGIFANAGLRLSDTTGIGMNDGILLVGADDTFTVTYVDRVDSTDSTSAWRTFRRTPSLSATAFNAYGYLPGESVSVTVTDLERNLDPLIRDTITVTVTNPARSDTETLLCLETTETSGVFSSTTSLGLQFLAAGVPGDSQIQVVIGDVITVRYVDPDSATDFSTDTAGVQFAAIYQIMLRTIPWTDTVTIVVSPRDAAGDSILSLEGITPVTILGWSGGTGAFLSTAETVVNGEARFVYSKLEAVTLDLVLQISSETYPVIAMIPAPGGTGMITVSDRSAAGSIGTMFIPAGLFPDGTRYIVENRNRINDSPVLAAILSLAASELESLPNVRLLSTTSNGSVLAEHQFRIISGGVEQTALPGAITIAVSYPDANGDGVVDGTTVLEQSLRIYRLNEVAARFEIEPNITREPAKNRVSVSVNHLTIFSVAGGPSISDLGSLSVYPNPFEPNSGLGHQYVTFENLPIGARLRIFTADGRLVDEAAVPAGSNSLQWHGNNRTGFPVASGVYVYVIEAAGTRKVGKVVVVR